ncbi:DNA (cytosine-5-)-methyltransferase [Scytonema sp. UIC 10036]|uniref:DNA cytosine methyltransferase n=1 Tax=Scytonema sp. UIC 10036 TaxID=2304196 RepID=UPI0012DA596D|nr:DNA cytosine methyltransferase [Scytonema sp. UIC 10036]MUG91220.1 DNA (cytosine-5-)-methyltransferase [Scytonema sp. UIC 10036]
MSENIVSLFSGAGGLSLGFALAGLKPGLGVDINDDACSTYESNLGIPCHNLDLNASDKCSLIDLLTPYKEVFAVIGGPPCQGFSTAGSRNELDSRNQLIFNYFAIVEYLKPKWFLFENVEGLLTSNSGKSVFELVRRFISLGYLLRLEKVNFAAYGLPQSRKRAIVIGNRIGAFFHFPPETHSFNAGKHNKVLPLFPNSPTLDEAISGLPEAVSQECFLPYTYAETSSEYEHFIRLGNNSGGVRHHFSTPSANELERYRLLKPGQTMKDLPESLWHPSFRKRAFRRVKDGTPTEKRGGAPAGIKRLYSHLCSPTITSASSREFIHPSVDRALTLRECARLQSFSDSYVFSGNTSSIAIQIGNAFPPLVAMKFAQHLMQIEGKAGSGLTSLKERKAQLIGYRLTDASGMSPALMHTESLLKSLMSNLG